MPNLLSFAEFGALVERHCESDVTLSCLWLLQMNVNLEK